MHIVTGSLWIDPLQPGDNAIQRRPPASAFENMSQTLKLGPRVRIFVDEIVGSARRRDAVVAAVAAKRV